MRLSGPRRVFTKHCDSVLQKIGKLKSLQTDLKKNYEADETVVKFLVNTFILEQKNKSNILYFLESWDAFLYSLMLFNFGFWHQTPLVNSGHAKLWMLM